MPYRPAWSSVTTETGLSYRERGVTKQLLTEWLDDLVLPTDLYVTFAWNKTTGFRPSRVATRLSEAQGDLDEFVKRIDGHCLGCRYHKKSFSERCTLICLPEHLETNLHYHGILRPGRFRSGEDLRDYVARCVEIWKHLVPAGSLDIQAAGTGVSLVQIRLGTVKPNSSTKAVIRYITKDLAAPGAWDGAFVFGAI